MEKKTKSAIMLTLLLISILTLALDIQMVKGWTGSVTIRADGSLSPPDAPISSADNVTYVLWDSIFGSIIVQRNGIVIDGAGHTLQGTGREKKGIDLAGRTNVTIQNTQIQNFTIGINLRDSSGISIIENVITANSDFGIHLAGSSGNTVIGNNITNSYFGIELFYGFDYSPSSNNIISGNTVTNSYEGIMVVSSSHNNVSGNTVVYCNFGIVTQSSSSNNIVGNYVTNNGEGVGISYSSNNVVSENNVAANTLGVYLLYSSDNSIIGNNITGNDEGIWLRSSSDNRFYHNHFIYNRQQVGVEMPGFANVWDTGYTSGGNYWSDYVGIDENKDGFGDTPYIIDTQNVDHYPLMGLPLIVDFEPPVLSIIYPYFGEVIRSSTVTISWKGADYESGISHYAITMDDEYFINVGLNTSYTFTELDDGQHIVRITAFDYAGNYVDQSIDFTVNAGIRFAWPPYLAEAVGTAVIVIVLGVIIYVLRGRYSFRERKPSRKLVR